jgi:hypothetical protein
MLCSLLEGYQTLVPTYQPLVPTYQHKWCHIPEENNLHSHYYENLILHTVMLKAVHN